jgi:hypothetical protein
MQTHIENAFSIINKYLPVRYVKKVQELAMNSGKELDPRIIHSVRARAPKYNMDNYIHIILLLVEVANENKTKIEKLKKITN